MGDKGECQENIKGNPKKKKPGRVSRSTGRAYRERGYVAQAEMAGKKKTKRKTIH